MVSRGQTWCVTTDHWSVAVRQLMVRRSDPSSAVLGSLWAGRQLMSVNRTALQLSQVRKTLTLTYFDSVSHHCKPAEHQTCNMASTSPVLITVTLMWLGMATAATIDIAWLSGFNSAAARSTTATTGDTLSFTWTGSHNVYSMPSQASTHRTTPKCTTAVITNSGCEGGFRQLRL